MRRKALIAGSLLLVAALAGAVNAALRAFDLQAAMQENPHMFDGGLAAATVTALCAEYESEGWS